MRIAVRIASTLFLCPLLVPIGHGQEKSGKTLPTVHKIKISEDCKANPDSIDVHENDKIRWCAKTKYKVAFDGKSPVPNVVALPADCQPRPIKRDSACAKDPNDYNGACYYPYKLSGSHACADPGVHVIPDGATGSGSKLASGQ